jgi:hypothetical protein
MRAQQRRVKGTEHVRGLSPRAFSSKQAYLLPQDGAGDSSCRMEHMFPGRKRFLLTRTVCPTLHEQRVPARMRAGRVNDQLSWMPMLALKGASDGMRRPVRHLNATATAPGLLGFWRANLTLFERVGRFRQKRGKSQLIKKKTTAMPGQESTAFQAASRGPRGKGPKGSTRILRNATSERVSRGDLGV